MLFWIYSCIVWTCSTFSCSFRRCINLTYLCWSVLFVLCLGFSILLWSICKSPCGNFSLSWYDKEYIQVYINIGNVKTYCFIYMFYHYFLFLFIWPSARILRGILKMVPNDLLVTSQKKHGVYRTTYPFHGGTIPDFLSMAHYSP